MDLIKLKKLQISLSNKLKLEDKINPDNVRFIAGIDLTYTNIWTNPTTGIACIVVFDIKTKTEKEIIFEKDVVDFPYIPTFLAFRELPLIKKAYRKLKTKVDVFMLDGMGIIHPRFMGIATHFGIVTDTVSIGVAKSHLTGKYKEVENKAGSFSKIYIENKHVGYVLRSKKNSKPIFISPGNNISLDSSLKITIKCLNGYKLPEPTRLAHNHLQLFRRKLLNG